MNFEPTYEFTSVAMPGVLVKLERIGPVKRAAIELSISKARAKQRELSLRYASIEKQIKDKLDADKALAAQLRNATEQNDGELSYVTLAAMDLPEPVMKLGEDLQTCLSDLTALSRSEIHPAFLKAAVISFNGEITYADKPATAELVCKYGPDDLFDELVAAINENTYLTGVAARNLASPTTSTAPEDGGQKNSTAQTVNGLSSTENETVLPSPLVTQ